MPVAENPVFKLISLRGAIDGLTIDPAGDLGESQVEKRLNGEIIDPVNPSPKVLQLIANFPTLTETDLQQSVLFRLHQLLQTKKALTYPTLAAIRFTDNQTEFSLAEFSATDAFKDRYRQLFDSWLKLRLLRSPEQLIHQHEDLLRTAHLCLRLCLTPDSLREPGVIGRLQKAVILFPRSWRADFNHQEELRAKYSARIDAATPPSISDRAQKIAQKKGEYAELVKQIAVLESIQVKANNVYTQWKKDQQKSDPAPLPGTPSIPRRRGGIFQRASNFFIGKPRSLFRSAMAPIPLLDNDFYTRLENQLTQAELVEFRPILNRRPPFLGEVMADLDPRMMIADANQACANIKIWEDEETQIPPESKGHQPSKDRPAVKAIGWGDLIVARERLVGYEAHEIAHIESILSGEKKVRKHERTKTTEQFTETETTRNTETERDLQTTNRFEIQSQTQKTIEQDFSIKAGVNTSGRYGLTKVETSLDAGFQQNTSESRSSSIQLAKDIVSRSVERTFESVRELRRLTITEQIRELNTHSVKNTPQDGSQVPDRSGIYVWVEKIHEVELRQYGKRLMVEFHIPEPAVSLLGLNDPQKKDIRKPAPFTIGPNEISQGNYLCLTRLYGAEEVESPPSQFIQVGFTWASTPDEGTDEDAAEDTISDTILIPDGYRPVSGNAILSTIWDHSWYADARLFIGGKFVTEIQGKPESTDGEFDFDPAERWPEGVPVSLRAHGHFDKTLVAHVTLRCIRTTEAMTAWQLRTWEKLRNAHQILIREFERATDEENFSAPLGIQIEGRPSAENRQVEIDELTKWAIKIMRQDKNFDYDAVVQVGDHPEIDPDEANYQAPVVRFFEEAFEWRQMSYFLYPYFWGRRDAWKLRQQISGPDPRHTAFLQAGAARVIVPVTPGYEKRVLYILDPNMPGNELDKIKGPKPADTLPPQGADAGDLWLELLIDKNEELALGSGTLKVRNNEKTVRINDDSAWLTSERDLGREIYLDGESYVIAAISDTDQRQFDLDQLYKGENNDEARYATGSVPYGSPWLVHLPTSLVILSDERGKLASL